MGYGLAVSGAKVIFYAEVALLMINPVRSVSTDSTGMTRVQLTAATLSAALSVLLALPL